MRLPSLGMNSFWKRKRVAGGHHQSDVLNLNALTLDLVNVLYTFSTGSVV
jgi:hypothetical protein